ncbi:MAG: type 4a pilus biogenesis protein PilO [Parcubacteria group bacterium]|nr:type 4a pilus biogenesis protein PilO [Parcubacteria group bacterium]
MNLNLFKYIILPFILFFAALAIGFWVLWPLYGDIQAAMLLKEQNQDNLTQRKKLTENLERLISQYNERGGDIASLNKAIPSGQNVPELLVNLEAIASESGLIFKGVNFKPKDLKAPGIKTLIAEIRVTGSYPDFLNYLKAMEKSLRIFDVTSISFAGVSPGQISARTDNIDFSLTVNTYYY